MRANFRRPWSGFQAKILAPVLAVMVALVVAPLGFAGRRLAAQFHSGAVDSLAASAAMFQNIREIQARDLLLRYGEAAAQPGFRAVAQQNDPATVAFALREMLGEFEADFALFTTVTNSVPARPEDRAAPFEALGAACVPVARDALAGRPAALVTAVDGRIYQLASAPVTVGAGVVGSLTLAREIGAAAAAEFRALLHCELVLMAGNRIAAATLGSADLAARLAPALEAGASRGLEVVVQGGHFIAMTGDMGGLGGDPRPRYVLLSSYEGPRAAQRAVRRTLLWVQAGLILVGGMLIGWVVRRASRPLMELRDAAKAVGGGDFTTRVRVHSRDECGELASVFNEMTENLQSSRRRLEETLETLRSTQAQLVQGEKLRAIGTLAGGIAHDFNSILAAILGFGEIALSDVPPGSRAERSLRQVMTAGNRAKHLVRQILAFSRSSGSRHERVRVGLVVEEASALLRATLPDGVRLEVRRSDGEDAVDGDPTQLHQVVLNLGTNAVQASKRSGGVVTLSVEPRAVPSAGLPESRRVRPGEYVRLSVSDTGEGIPPGILERIFEPFFTTKPVGEGTGLGLSVVHGIVQSHRGEITVSSEPGCGSLFEVWLPRAAPSPPDSAGDASRLAQAPGDAPRAAPGSHPSHETHPGH